MKTIEKYPNETIHIAVSFANRLGETDYVVATTWYVPNDMQSDTDTHQIDTQNVLASFSGGAPGQTYEIRNLSEFHAAEELETRISVFVRPGSSLDDLEESLDTPPVRITPD